jgi:hypothetical protein
MASFCGRKDIERMPSDWGGLRSGSGRRPLNPHIGRLVQVGGAVPPEVSAWLDAEVEAGRALSKSALVAQFIQESIAMMQSRTYRVAFNELPALKRNDNFLDLSTDRPAYLESIELVSPDLDAFWIVGIQVGVEYLLRNKVRGSMLREGNLFRLDGYNLHSNAAIRITLHNDDPNLNNGPRVGGWCTFSVPRAR